MLNKINIVDIMKGISILMIIFFHMIGQLNLDLDKTIRMLSYQGVNTFLLLSGFTLILSLNHNTTIRKDSHFWFKWIKAKFLRLSILYYIVLSMTLFFYLINLKLLNISILSNHTMLDFLLHFTYLHIYFDQTYFSISPVFWFMGAIALFYLFVPLLYIANRYILVIIFLLLLYFYSHNIYISKPQITLSLLFFIFGILSSYYYHELQNNNPIGFTFVIILVLLIINIGFLKDIKINSYLYLFISFTSVCIIYMISVAIDVLSNKFNSLSKISTLLIYFGKISFPMYLIHWQLIKPVFAFINNYYIAIVLYFFIVIVLSLILLRIERFVINNVLTSRIKRDS